MIFLDAALLMPATVAICASPDAYFTYHAGTFKFWRRGIFFFFFFFFGFWGLDSKKFKRNDLREDNLHMWSSKPHILMLRQGSRAHIGE